MKTVIYWAINTFQFITTIIRIMTKNHPPLQLKLTGSSLSFLVKLEAVLNKNNMTVIYNQYSYLIN